MYAGYGAFMLRDLPFDAIEFVSYEQVCAHLIVLIRERERVCERGMLRLSLTSKYCFHSLSPQLKIAAQGRLGRELHPVETSLIGAIAGGFTGDCMLCVYHL